MSYCPFPGLPSLFRPYYSPFPARKRVLALNPAFLLYGLNFARTSALKSFRLSCSRQTHKAQMKADSPRALRPRPRKRKEETDPLLSSPVPSLGFSTPSSYRPSQFRWRRSQIRPERGGVLCFSRSREYSEISRDSTPDLCARETPSFPFPWLAARRPHGKRGLLVAAVRGATGPCYLSPRARAGRCGKPGAGSLRPLEPRPRASGRPGHA